jgi:plastocyanin
MAAGTRRRLALGAVALGLALWGVILLAGSLGAAEAAPKPATHTVTIDATSYSPRTLTVHPGDTVVWVNQDLIAHTATAKNGSFESGDIPPGKSWKYAVRSEGLFAYACDYHVTMKGTLRVR